MARIYGEEFVIGEISSESHYNPHAIPPTWQEFLSLLESEEIDEFALTPLGKIGSRGRAFGSTSIIVTKQDAYNVLAQAAGGPSVIQQGKDPDAWTQGDLEQHSNILARAAIIGSNSANSAAMMKDLANLRQGIIHLTGIAIKAIR